MKYIFLFLTSVLICNQSISQIANSASVGVNMASIGNRESAVIRTNSFEGGTYAEFGAMLEYRRSIFSQLNKDSNANDSINISTKANRLGINVGARLNYARYGILLNIYNPMIQYGYQFKSIEFSGIFNMSYRLTPNMFIYGSLIAGFRINHATGDKFVADYYKLTYVDQSSRLRKYNAAWDLGARWKIKTRLFFDLGYTNGMINLIKAENDEVPMLREFYPYLRTTLNF